MTKVEALLRRLVLMRQEDGSAKALVFSQYPEALSLVSKALKVLQVVGFSKGLVGRMSRFRVVTQSITRCSF